LENIPQPYWKDRDKSMIPVINRLLLIFKVKSRFRCRWTSLHINKPPTQLDVISKSL